MDSFVFSGGNPLGSERLPAYFLLPGGRSVHAARNAATSLLHPYRNKGLRRGKGGKTGKRELPRPAFEAIEAWLTCIGRDLATLRAEASLWPDTKSGRGITSGTFYTNLRRHLKNAGLPVAGVHIFRHSAAKLRRDAGETIEEVSRFLDHGSLAVTTTYLRRLEGQEDRTWEKVASVIGI